MKRFFLSLLILLILAGCSKPVEQTTPLPPESTPLPPTSTPLPTSTPTPSGPTLPPEPQDKTHYQLELILNYYTHYGVVTEEITYTNKTSLPLEEILLVIPPKVFENSYTQTNLSGERVANYIEEGIFTRVLLTQPLQPGEITRLKINFRIDFPLHQGIFAYTNQQTNISDWYPFIPPYDEELGWLAYNRIVDQNNIIVGEHIVNEFSDFDVSLQLTDHFDLIEVAASAPATLIDGIYHYRLENARAFSFSVSDSFFQHEITQDGVTIRSYVFYNQVDSGIAVTEIASKALALFAELFYPYQRELISIVVGDFLHNMEMDGLIMISYGIFDFYDNTPLNNLTIITPHELSHQWFYGAIGSNHALEPWLDEAMATYMEYLFYERYYPEHTSWWWNARVDSYGPNGYVDSPIQSAGTYEQYRNAVYLRGAHFLHEIRAAVGDEAFFASLKDYTYTHTYDLASRADFFSAFSRHSDVDLNPIISRYFRP